MRIGADPDFRVHGAPTGDIGHERGLRHRHERLSDRLGGAGDGDLQVGEAFQPQQGGVDRDSQAEFVSSERCLNDGRDLVPGQPRTRGDAGKTGSPIVAKRLKHPGP